MQGAQGQQTKSGPGPPENRIENADHPQSTSILSSLFHPRGGSKLSKERPGAGKSDSQQPNETKEIDASSKRLQKTIDEKDVLINSLTANLNEIKETNKILAQRLDDEAKSYSSKLEDSQDKYSSMESFYKSAAQAAQETIGDKDHTISELQNATWLLKNDNNSLSEKLRKTENEFLVFRNKYEDETKYLNGLLETEAQKIAAIEKNNIGLRQLISRTSKVQEPLRGEDYYIQCFEDLKNDIESWVVTYSKKNANATLTPPVPNLVLGKINTLGDHGQHIAEYLRLQIPHLKLLQVYNSKKTRIPLIRHVIALFLFDQIFEPFAFGLTRDSSDRIKDIEDRLFKQG